MLAGAAPLSRDSARSSSFRSIPVSFDPLPTVARSKRRANADGVGAAVKRRARNRNAAAAEGDDDAADSSVANESEGDTNVNRYVRLSDPEFVCVKRQCKQRAASWDAFVEHQVSAHQSFVGVCPVVGCERVFLIAASLQAHWARHAAPDVACAAPQCARLEAFASWRDYRTHCRLLHAVRAGDQCAERCGFVAKSVTAMQLHTIQKHPISSSAIALMR